MGEQKITDRIEFLAKKFDIFEVDEKSVATKVAELKENGYEYSIVTNDSTVLAIVSSETKGSKKRFTRNISVSLDVFSDIIAADPTSNKSCVQWMLTTFIRFIRDGGTTNIASAIRFVVEDLPQASIYLKLFEANKRKNKFKEFCKNSYILSEVEDPTDINQYKSLSQLFDAVDPFIEKNPTEIESLLNRYVQLGQAIIPVRDRKFTLYIPKSTDASVVFHNFANWCTAKPKNGMFNSYTSNLRPNGKKSDLYIIINNKFFTGESQEIYQIHFQSNQIKDRHNTQTANLFENVLSQSDSLSRYFKEELIEMAIDVKTNLEDNKYLDYLISFGFCESLFEIINVNSPVIRFMSRKIPRLPDMSRFKMLDQLIICNASLAELHSSIGKLTNLEMLVLCNNNIKVIPKEIGALDKMTFLNIIGNPITEIPDEIKYLDKSNGGSLLRIAVRKEEIGEENYQKLIRLLPTTNINNEQK